MPGLIMISILLLNVWCATVAQATILWSKNWEDNNTTSGLDAGYGGTCFTSGPCPWAVTTVSSPAAAAGTYSARFELNGDDPGTVFGVSTLRSELRNYDIHPRYGVERWYGIAIKIDSAWTDTTTDPNGTIVSQWHVANGEVGEGAKGPQLAIEVTAVAPRKWVIGQCWCIVAICPVSDPPQPSCQNKRKVEVGTVVYDTWVRWVVHAKWALDSTGVIEVWKDGVKVIGSGTSNNWDGPNAWNDPASCCQSGWFFGIYKSWWNQITEAATDTLIAYHDEVKMGDQNSSFNEVNPGGSTDVLAPKPPTGFTVTTQSATQINLAWTKPTQNTDNSSYTDPGGYTVRYCLHAGCNPATGTPIDLGDVASFNHTGLVSETVYRYDVAAFDDDDNFSTFFTPVQQATTQAPPPPTPVVYYKFDEVSGTDAADDGPNNLDATLCSGATCATQGPSWIAGPINNAISCDGVNDNVERADNAALDITGDLTIAFWLKVLSTLHLNGPASIVTKEQATSPFPSPYLVEVVNATDPTIRYYHFSGSGSDNALLDFTAHNLPPINTVFEHITLTREAATRKVRLYASGNFIQELTYGSQNPTANASPLRICTDASRASGRYGHLAIDELRLYNGVLNDQQIASLAVGAPGATPVFAQDTWRWRHIDTPETGGYQRPEVTEGHIVVGNQARLRTALANTGDTSGLQNFALYCRTPAGSGTYWALDSDCVTNPLCYGLDEITSAGQPTSGPQLTVAGASYASGGKIYMLSGSAADFLTLAADQYVEREHTVQLRSNVSLGTTFGCCERLGDGTTLSSCNEATARVVDSHAFLP